MDRSRRMYVLFMTRSFSAVFNTRIYSEPIHIFILYFLKDAGIRDADPSVALVGRE